MSEFQVPKRIKKAKSTNINPDIANVVLIVVSALLAGIVAFHVYLLSLPPIRNLDEFKPNIVTKFYSSDDEIIKTFTAFTFSKVDLKDIPDNLKNAIIATEDKNFYKHRGYDITGLVRSTFANVLAGHVVQGASTITQQLARILFLSNEKTFTRKIKELIIAARIEKTIPKSKILEMYLNNVYLGSGAYGVEGASQIYFNKHLKDLTLAESALLAGLPQAPSVYSPFNNEDLAIERRNQVLKRMYKMRFITKKEYQKAVKEKLKLNPLPEIYTLNKAPYFCDYVMKELEKLGFDEVEISQGGYKVITTIDYKTQQQTNEAIIRNLNGWGLRGEKQQAAVFSFSPIDGRILAYAGGKDYSKSQYDRVTQAVRPPGSAFKPFIYAAAVEKGLDPNDLIEDAPFKAGDWAPRNYHNKYRGKIPAYKALMISSNVCAARVIQSTGIRSVIQMARLLGISTPLEYDYTIALGSNGVKLFEITRAYGAFANGGYRVEPYGIERVESSRGQVIYQAPKAKISKVIDTNTAAIMTAMLKTVMKSGTGVAANIGKPAAGKTGTTDDYKDACFIGYTPDVVTGVWVGNDDNTKIGNLTGGTVPALIWRDVMKVATAPYGNADFDYPKVELKNYSAAQKEEKAEGEEEITDENATDSTTLENNEILPSDVEQPVKKPSAPATPKQISAPKASKPNQLAPIPMATPAGIN
ncbi:MAG TPA: PBP1A family penicillin-binding protein [Candidatus Gastranaerophilaceae bacterium]|nr:PBP1A family penicillin-binding protein [Candidatus Gastranaerophilaceae bacterium]